MNVGALTIEALYQDLLKADPEGSIHTPAGFTWWADQYAQHIEVIGADGAPEDDRGVLVVVRTEVLREVTLDEVARRALNNLLMAFASLAGPVYDPTTCTVQLYSRLWLHEDTRPWMTPLLRWAALLQLSEAQRRAPELATLLHTDIAASGPPARGLRPTPDERMAIVPRLIAPHGAQPNRWSAAEFTDTVERFLQQPPAVLATGGGAGFTVEFPFGDQTSLCQALGDQPHPSYGNGLFLLQSFPIDAQTEAEGLRLALDLNRVEFTEPPAGYGLGSYCYQHHGLHFVSFFPNIAYRAGLLPNLYYAAAQRARDLAVRLTGQDWTPESFALARSGTGR